PFLVAPTATPFRPGKHRDLTHRPLLSALLRAHLRPVDHLIGKAGPTGWVPFDSGKHRLKRHPNYISIIEMDEFDLADRIKRPATPSAPT
ncbi:hypothetical protein, partial [Novosphingobium sp. YAF33]|uniref:hypothetical protein n=1 Tax=Novosphingobium sp. YAF33 TaxID=3233082 RepID=UPI003F9A6992